LKNAKSNDLNRGVPHIFPPFSVKKLIDLHYNDIEVGQLITMDTHRGLFMGIAKEYTPTNSSGPKKLIRKPRPFPLKRIQSENGFLYGFLIVMILVICAICI